MSPLVARLRERFGTALPLALALGVLLRLALFVIALQNGERRLEPDSSDYLALAENLPAALGAKSGDLLDRLLFRGPGYPVFVALASALGGLSGVLLLQLVLSAGTVILVHRLAEPLVDRPCANAAAAIAAIEPLGILFANKILSETLFTFLLVAGVHLFVLAIRRPDSGRALSAGLILGAAALVRSIGLYLPLILAVLAWTLQERPRRRSIVAFLLLGALVPVGAWTIRNAARTGDAVFTTSDGRTLLEFRVAPMVAREKGIGVEQARAELSERVKLRLDPNAGPAERNPVQRAVALEELARHPWAAIKTQAFYTARLLWGPGQASLAQSLGRSSLLGVGVLGLFVVFVYVSAARGVKALLDRTGGRPALWIAGAVLFYFVVASSLTDGYARFRVPMMPFLAVLAGAGWATCKQRRDIPAAPV